MVYVPATGSVLAPELYKALNEPLKNRVPSGFLTCTCVVPDIVDAVTLKVTTRPTVPLKVRTPPWPGTPIARGTAGPLMSMEAVASEGIVYSDIVAVPVTES